MRHVVIDMEAVTDVDATGAETFDALLGWLHQRDVSVAFSRVRPSARSRLAELGLLGDRNVYETNRAALAALAVGGPDDPLGASSRTPPASAEGAGDPVLPCRRRVREMAHRWLLRMRVGHDASRLHGCRARPHQGRLEARPPSYNRPKGRFRFGSGW